MFEKNRGVIQGNDTKTERSGTTAQVVGRRQSKNYIGKKWILDKGEEARGSNKDRFFKDIRKGQDDGERKSGRINF